MTEDDAPPRDRDLALLVRAALDAPPRDRDLALLVRAALDAIRSSAASSRVGPARPSRASTGNPGTGPA